MNPLIFQTIVCASFGATLAKEFTLRDGRVQSDPVKPGLMFAHGQYQIKPTHAGVATLLRHLANKPRQCLVHGVTQARGQPILRRNKTTLPYPENGISWVMVDIDGMDPPRQIGPCGRQAMVFARRALPAPFNTAWCVAQLSGSAGVHDANGTLLKPGIRCHLFFIFASPVDPERVRAILRHAPSVDLAVLGSSQPLYTADAILGPGVMRERYRRRIRVLRGRNYYVELPDPPTPLTRFPGHRKSLSSAPSTPWVDPPAGLPTVADIMQCDFMRWFVTEPSIGTGRYHAARAFATNAYRTVGDSERRVREGLDVNRPDGYERAETIVDSLPNSRPISCHTIVKTAFQCPKFDERRGRCSRDHCSTTPFGLALNHAKRRGSRS